MDVQLFGRQDPYVSAVLVGPNGAQMSQGRTCTVWRGGTNPKWGSAGGNSIWLPYLVRRGDGLRLKLSVWDEERNADDQLIGSGVYGPSRRNCAASLAPSVSVLVAPRIRVCAPCHLVCVGFSSLLIRVRGPGVVFGVAQTCRTPTRQT
jgi:hypothetical protein